MTPLAQNVTFTSGNSRLSGYIARPTDSGPSPGVIVIHEAYGLNDNIRDISRRLAGEGYIALAVDLFSGRNRAFCMFKVMGGLLLNPLNNEGTRYLKAALTFLGEQEGVDVSRLGAIGFCMGGGFALVTSTRGFDAASANYGLVPRDAEQALAGACPIVASYGARDLSMRGAAAKLERTLSRLHVEHDVKEYPNAGHSFLNDEPNGPLPLRPLLKILHIGPEPESAKDAWARIESFFAEHLRG